MRNANNREMEGSSGDLQPAIWLGLIGALLTIINNIIATLALGVFQGPFVAFTTPFAFCLARLRYPKLPAASIIYLPVVIVSIFTLNFGPPGHYKVTFILGAVLYDAVCYFLRVGVGHRARVALWKLIIAVFFYPIGLLLGALLAISWVAVELPILSRGWVGVVIFEVVFGIVGIFATWLCHRVYYKWLQKELTE